MTGLIIWKLGCSLGLVVTRIKKLWYFSVPVSDTKIHTWRKDPKLLKPVVKISFAPVYFHLGPNAWNKIAGGKSWIFYSTLTHAKLLLMSAGALGKKGQCHVWINWSNTSLLKAFHLPISTQAMNESVLPGTEERSLGFDHNNAGKFAAS